MSCYCLENSPEFVELRVTKKLLFPNSLLVLVVVLLLMMIILLPPLVQLPLV